MLNPVIIMKKPQYVILDIPFPETAALERQVIADVIQSPDMMGDVLPLIHKDFFTNTERCGIWELLTTTTTRAFLLTCKPSQRR